MVRNAFWTGTDSLGFSDQPIAFPRLQASSTPSCLLTEGCLGATSCQFCVMAFKGVVESAVSCDIPHSMRPKEHVTADNALLSTLPVSFVAPFQALLQPI